MNGANLSRGACVCKDEKTTRLPESAHDAQWMCLQVCHASIHVVIGIRVVLCHPLVHIFGLSTSCPNSHLVVML